MKLKKLFKVFDGNTSVEVGVCNSTREECKKLKGVVRDFYTNPNLDPYLNSKIIEVRTILKDHSSIVHIAIYAPL